MSLPALRYMQQYSGISEGMQTVTLRTSGAGSLLVNGIAVRDPGSGIACQYPAGTVISVTAMPDKGASFERWSGASAETAQTISITVSENMNLTAAFQEAVRGDVNADGECNIADALMLVQYLLGKGRVIAAEQADLDGNKRLNAVDLSMLKHILLA